MTSSIAIPLRDVRFRFARGGGPGGQNVNKVETRVELLFDLAGSTVFSDAQKQRLLRVLASRLDEDGILHVMAGESRSQWQNRERALGRLAALLREALTPRKKRVATRPSRGSKEERFREKKQRGATKRLRGRVDE